MFFKLQLVMFFEGLRSERGLVRGAADRLSIRWYLGYDLHEELPNHSSLTRIRQRYGRRLPPLPAADYFDRVRGYYRTAAYEKVMAKRKVWVEPLFGEAKDWHSLRRFRLRGLWKANAEARLIATGQDLKRLLKKRDRGRRPWPNGAPEAPFARRFLPQLSTWSPSLV